MRRDKSEIHSDAIEEIRIALCIEDGERAADAIAHHAVALNGAAVPVFDQSQGSVDRVVVRQPHSLSGSNSRKVSLARAALPRTANKVHPDRPVTSRQIPVPRTQATKQTRIRAERVPAWSEGKLCVALDLHCPWIRGPHNEVIYFVGGPDAANWHRVSEFAQVLETMQQGPLVYKVTDNLPYGRGWNTAANEAGLKSFGRWAAELPGIQIASTIEIPYANAGGKEVDADSARAFGRDLARALRRYLDH